jgi:hypothetical protein
MIAPFSSNTTYSPKTLSVTPAWRNTLVHFIVVAGWPPNISPSNISSVYADITAKTQKLRDLSPDTGAYFNEADANEPDWQWSFWGKNYAKLARIKRRVDPGTVLRCHRCVGSEVLEEREDGRLCRVKGYGVRTEDGRGGKRREEGIEKESDAGNVDVQTKWYGNEIKGMQRAN